MIEYHSRIMASSSKLPSVVDKHNFLFKKILNHDPEDAWQYCVSLQKKWNEEYSKDPELAKRMEEFKKTRCIHLVWVSDSFGGSLSEEISQWKTYRLLSQMYDSGSSAAPEGVSDQSSHQSSAEDDRKSERQLRQHLNALLFILKAAETKRPLSEELIKRTHRLLMEDLYIEDKKINAGKYRLYSVGAGPMHTYPDFSCIPATMVRIVEEYGRRCLQDHNSFELASWLLYELLTIHPFEDGNGRVSRLLWCYSLLRDGLLFPVTPFPGLKKAYKKYVTCIDRDRQCSSSSLTPSCKHLTSLTLISVTKTWKNFVLNLRNECPEKYKLIVEWLQTSKNTLPSLHE